MSLDFELIPGASPCALGPAERVALFSFRLLASGGGRCPTLQMVLSDILGKQGPVAHAGLDLLVRSMNAQARRKLAVGCPCMKGLTWDEAAVLGLIAAAQHAEPALIARWFDRLGVHTPRHDAQRGLVWAATAFSVAGFLFDPDVGDLGLAAIKARRAPRLRSDANRPDNRGAG
jgi:hypothetical protein